MIECENRPCIAENGRRKRQQDSSVTTADITPLLTPPGVVNNPKSQTTTHLITRGTVNTTSQ